MRAIEKRQDYIPLSAIIVSDHAHSERRNPLNCAFMSHMDERHEQHDYRSTVNPPRSMWAVPLLKSCVLSAKSKYT